MATKVFDAIQAFVDSVIDSVAVLLRRMVTLVFA